MFAVGPGPALQAAFEAAPTAAEELAAAVARADSDSGTDEEAWEFLEGLAARADAVGTAVSQWKVETQDRLLGQYDITSIAGREEPRLMLQNLHAILQEKPSEESEQKRQQEADRIRSALPAEPPAVRADFDRLLEDARTMNRLRDERSLYGVLRGGGLLRRALLRLGSRVQWPVDEAAADGATHNADLMIFASPSELKDLFAKSGVDVTAAEEAAAAAASDGQNEASSGTASSALSVSPELYHELCARRTFFETYSVDDVPAYINGPEYPRPDLAPALSKAGGPCGLTNARLGARRPVH